MEKIHSGTILYEYDPLMRIKKVTDPEGRVRKFEYTKSGKLHAVYFCGRKDQELIYDNAGRVEKRTFAYVTTEGVAVVSNTGRLITAWTKDTFDANMIEIVERLCGE